MNKTKKIAMAAVSVVMAGAMLVPLAACKKGGSGNSVAPITSFNDVDHTATVGGLTLNLSEDNRLAYSNTTTVRLDVHDGANHDRRPFYHADQFSGEKVMPDGNTYEPGDLKPAWKGAMNYLGMNFGDASDDDSSDAQIDNAVTNPTDADLVTGSGAKIVSDAAIHPDNWLDLNQYLDYMPNFKAFLNKYPIVRMSLTSDTTNGAMYYAPYFDGNDDIEKYVLMKREWVRVILDKDDISAATTTFAAQATAKASSDAAIVSPTGTSASAEAFMGTEGSYTVETTDPTDPDGVKVTTLKVNYDAAKTAATTAGTELYQAINDAAGSAYNGNSGNIIDLQNYAINQTEGAVSGEKLAKILRAYIDVAYQKEDGSKFYTTRSDVFNSAAAGWDVDLYVAMCRCAVTCVGLYDSNSRDASKIYAIAGRENNNKGTQRRMDVMAFIGELYGVRGMESRYDGFTYIDGTGALKDARLDAKMYEAAAKFSALAKEGLTYMGSTNVAGDAKAGIQVFSEHDYAQTQTSNGFYADGIPNQTDEKIVADGELKYDFAPILTPVSRWDVDGSSANGNEKVMRFTESWRAVKNTGFGIPKANVQNNPDKLSAILNLIDYMFSNDGQIMFSYGPESTNGNVATANGFWYGVEDEDKTGHLTAYADPADPTNPASQYIIKDQYKKDYFVYQNRVYTGTLYKGSEQAPILTDNTKNLFYDQTVNGISLTGLGLGSLKFNYTNFARGIIGSALPLGNKLQSFEYQATSKAGLDGTAIVGLALANGTVKHLVQNPEECESLWYLLVPTTLPLNSNESSATSSTTQPHLAGSDNSNYFINSSSSGKPTTNLIIGIAWYGFDTTKDICGTSTNGKLPADAAAAVQLVQTAGMDARLAAFSAAWNRLYAWYTAD